MSDLFGVATEAANSPIGWSALGSVATLVLNVLFESRRTRDRRQIADDEESMKGRNMAFNHLKELVETLNQEVVGLRASLVAESHVRREAERQVDEMRRDIDHLRTALSLASPAAVIVHNHGQQNGSAGAVAPTVTHDPPLDADYGS